MITDDGLARERMTLPNHKTKIVCTIGPSSRNIGIIKRMIRAGMNVARLNFSHGDLDEHEGTIGMIRTASRELGWPVTILADLPGPKIRLGTLLTEPINLKKGDTVTLTTRNALATSADIPVLYERLPESVSPGSPIYVNDGAILLKVLRVSDCRVECRVVIGGLLRSHKGINLPGARIFAEPVSEKDLALVDFGLKQGIDVFCVSFVERQADIIKVKEFAKTSGKDIYVVAKIERSQAIANIDGILDAADGIMVARGDLGVEIPIEEIPVVQKKLIQRANMRCRPVITATQMLLSMTENTRPTRAESTDVANAILDGTDAVMLSEETAVGSYPVETVKMMAKIAAATERHRKRFLWTGQQYGYGRELPGTSDISEVISRGVMEAACTARPRFVLTPTTTGATARRVSRFKLDPWILAFSRSRQVAAFLILSYGVFPSVLDAKGDDWHAEAIAFLKENGLGRSGDVAILTQGQFSPHHRTTDSMALITIP